MTTARRRLRPVAALVVLLLALPAAAEPEVKPREFVQAALDEIMAVLNDTSLSVPERREQVQDLAFMRFDFDTISRLVLARRWRGLSEQQRTEFTEEFKRHLTESYWKTLYDNRGRKVEVGDVALTKRGDAKVRTEIELDAAQPFLIDYRLREKGERWYVIDVIIEGISLVQNFRTQTQEIISDVGIDHLIEELRKKNEGRGDSE